MRADLLLQILQRHSAAAPAWRRTHRGRRSAARHPRPSAGAAAVRVAARAPGAGKASPHPAHPAPRPRRRPARPAAPTLSCPARKVSSRTSQRAGTVGDPPRRAARGQHRLRCRRRREQEIRRRPGRSAPRAPAGRRRRASGATSRGRGRSPAARRSPPARRAPPGRRIAAALPAGRGWRCADAPRPPARASRARTARPARPAPPRTGPASRPATIGGRSGQRLGQVMQVPGEGFALLPGIKPQPAGPVRRGGQRLGGGEMRAQQVGRRAGRARRAGRRSHPAPASSASSSAADLASASGPATAATEARSPASPAAGRGPRSADAFHPPRRHHPVGAVHAAGTERMLQHRQQRHRREAFRHHPPDQTQEGGGGGLGQRFAGRIIGGDAVAGEFGRDAPRQVAIRRDQRGAFARCLDAFAQQQGDRRRLLLRIRRRPAATARQRRRPARAVALRPGSAGPRPDAARGPTAPTDPAAPPPAPARARAAHHRAPRPSPPAAAPGRQADASAPAAPPPTTPAPSVPAALAAPPPPAGAPGQHAQQFRRRRDGAAGADAGRDGRVLRRRVPPGRRLRRQRLHPPHADIEQPAFGQPARSSPAPPRAAPPW